VQVALLVQHILPILLFQPLAYQVLLIMEMAQTATGLQHYPLAIIGMAPAFNHVEVTIIALALIQLQIPTPQKVE